MGASRGRRGEDAAKIQDKYSKNAAKTQHTCSKHTAKIQQKYMNMQQKYSKVLQDAILWCEEGEERRPPPKS